ncbi:MAG: GtrA family protein [Proteobacteria bacterium]|nr:GtrA family protein [Pseudomonadota bacterium]
MGKQVLVLPFWNEISPVQFCTVKWKLILKLSKEFIRYVVVGAAMNGCGFLLYALFTTLGVSPVLTISIFYPIYIGLAFYLNKKWSFNHKGRISASAVRYLISYIGCYVLNVAVLKFFSGYLGYPHLVVQAIAILVFALLLFLAQKYWVFRTQVISIAHVQHL